MAPSCLARSTSPGVACEVALWATLLLVLLAIIQVAGPHASLNILGRYIVLSYDNPATQVLDELALEKNSFTNAFAELLGATGIVAESWRRALVASPIAFINGEVLSGCISRSPPVA